MDTKEEILEESLEKQIQQLEAEVPESKPQNDLKEELKYKSKKNDRSLIKNVNNQVLIDFLSPEISKNEFAKRLHKYILIVLLTFFLVIQFNSVYRISLRVIDYSISEKANGEIVKSLLAFVSAYITSVVVELIAILKYIVKNVFDTSLAELVKIFKEKPKEQEK